MPTFPGGEGKGRDWKDACAGETDGLASSLAYLDARTAHRHVFLVSKGAPKAAEDGCDPWWRRPEGLLRRALRFAYSDAYDAGGRPGLPFYGPFRLDDDEVAARLAEDPLDDTASIPHLHSVPYPSSIHASRSARTPPWAVGAGAHGASLASFVGEPRAVEKGNYARARPKLIADCAAAPDAACRVYDPHAANRLGETGAYAKARGRHFCGLEETTQRATFCLEPGGDSPYRKGFYDALATGCIPVVFSQYARAVAPHHWGSFRNASTVFVDEAAYAAGDLDLFAFLRGIPGDAVAAMQRTIDAHAHRLMYALDDYPHDAVENILVGAAHLARRREKRRAPGR